MKCSPSKHLFANLFVVILSWAGASDLKDWDGSFKKLCYIYSYFKLLKEADIDEDGFLSYSEFENVIARSPEFMK